MVDTSSINYNKYKDANKQICDALGCKETASKKIIVNAGKCGTISLSICKNCIEKFDTLKGYDK
jgi:hypothetical protein